MNQLISLKKYKYLTIDTKPKYKYYKNNISTRQPKLYVYDENLKYFFQEKINNFKNIFRSNKKFDIIF